MTSLDTILTDNPLNDSMIEKIKSIPGVTDVMTREIVFVNLNGTRFPADIVSKNDFDFMRQDGDIGSMDNDHSSIGKVPPEPAICNTITITQTALPTSPNASVRE